MNEASFELGNLVAESQLDHDHLATLVDAYHGRVSPGLLARAELWGLAGRYAWTLWGAIQHGVSDVAHDFWDFAMERFELALPLMTGARLDAVLDAAGGSA
jgi:thiamine kinase-like enzyme